MCESTKKDDRPLVHTAEDMIREFLSSKAYDGLVNLELPCGCCLDDLMPGGKECLDVENCVAAYKHPCKKNTAAFCMRPTKNSDINCEECDAQ